MKKKREYIPANIRAGFTAKDALRTFSTIYAGQYGAPFKVCITTYDHGRDVNGNGTAHYKCDLILTRKSDGRELFALSIVQSGKRREQVGYGSGNQAALYALEKLGFDVDTSKAGSYDYQGEAYYPLLNFPPVEQ